MGEGRTFGKMRALVLLCAGACAFFTAASWAWHPGSAVFWRANSVLHLLVFLGCWRLFYVAAQKLTKRRAVFCGVGGAVLGLCMAVGCGIKIYTYFRIMLPAAPGFAFLFFALLVMLFAKVDERTAAGKPVAQNTAHGQAVVPRVEKQAAANGARIAQFAQRWRAFWRQILGPELKPAWKLFLLVLLLWLPWVIVCLPGLVSLDVTVQMQMWFGQAVFSAHHPPLHTAYMGVCMQLGKALFGNLAAGVGIAALVQMLALAALVTAALKQMAVMGIRFAFRVAALLFFTVLPLSGWYAMTLWKDVWLAGFVLLFVLATLRIARDGRAFFKSRGWVAVFATSLVGVLVSKNTGVYILAISLFGMLLALKGCRAVLAAALGGVLALQFLITGPIYGALGIVQGDVREMLSIPMMQLSYVVVTDDASLTEEDKALIATVLPYDDIPELYQNWISDNIKAVFNSEAFRQDPGKYVSLWLRVGLGHTQQYLRSFLEQTLGYWYPDVQHWVLGSINYPEALVDLGNFLGEDEPNAGKYADPLEGARVAVLDGVAEARWLPGISSLFSIGLYFWALLCAGLYLAYTKRRRFLLVLLPLAVVWLTCLASPVYAEFRYAWPAILCVPVVLGLAFAPRRLPS